MKVDALDRAFSKFIRLRDSDDNGLCRCISCGKLHMWDDIDCGHFVNRRHMGTRFDEKNCNAQCRSCLTPDALVLMSDLRWKMLGDVKVGETILAFDETMDLYKTSRRYKTSMVLSVEREMQDVYEVTLANGDKIKATADHRWLARRGKTSGFQWIKTDSLWVNSRNLKGNHITGARKEDVSSTVCKPFRIIEQDLSYESGWIAGMIDADGHITQQVVHDKRNETKNHGLRIGISQSDGEIADKSNYLLQKLSDNRVTCRADMPKTILQSTTGKEYHSKTTVRTYLITGTNVEKIEFLQKTRPVKLSKININKLGKMRSQYDTVVKSIKYIGKMEIVALETDAHTFIANGYAMHNCNSFDEGNAAGYAKGLIEKYGAGIIDELLLKKSLGRKWSQFEIDELAKYYREKCKELLKTKQI